MRHTITAFVLLAAHVIVFGLIPKLKKKLKRSKHLKLMEQCFSRSEEYPNHSVDLDYLQKKYKLEECYKLDYSKDREFIEQIITAFESMFATQFLQRSSLRFEDDTYYGYDYLYLRNLDYFCDCLLTGRIFDHNYGPLSHNKWFDTHKEENSLKNAIIDDNYSFNKTNYHLTEKGIIVCKTQLICGVARIGILENWNKRKSKEYHVLLSNCKNQVDSMKETIISNKILIVRYRP